MEKKISIGLATVLLGAMMLPAAWAQDAAAPAGPLPSGGPGMRGGHGNPDEQVRHITRAVGLTSEQQAQVRQIVQDRDAKMAQLQPGPGRREQMRSLAMDGDAKIRAILTDEQKPKFDAWRSEQMSKRQAMRQGGGGAPPPADGSGPPTQ